MKRKNLIHFVFLSGLFLLLGNSLQAGHLPIKSYTTFDGLANDSVNKIVRDSRGFLWFCTGEGLSRFDGFEFKNYTQTQGLPHRNINDLLETRDGDLLVATSGGLVIFDPNGVGYRWNILTSKLKQTAAAPPMFRTLPLPDPAGDPRARSILTLTQSQDGRIFAGTARALFQIEKTGDDWSFRKIESGLFNNDIVFPALAFDSNNYLWLVTSAGIYRMSPDNVIVNVGGDGGGSVLVDDQDRVWVGGSGTKSGLRLFTVSGDGKTAQLQRVYRETDGLPAENSMYEIKQASDGRILVIAGQTLCEFLPDAAEGRPKFRVIARGNFQSVTEDGGGSLWLGTVQEGAWKLAQTGFVKFDTSDGLSSEDIISLFTNPAGELFLASGKQNILHFTAGRFESVDPLDMETRSWGVGKLDFQSANGDWWIPANNGLRIYQKPDKFSDLGKTQPKKIFTTADGLFSNEVFNLFQDSRGDVWIATIGAANTLNRWEQQTGKIYRYTSDDGLPGSNGPVAFGEDAAGNVWFGYFFGGLARYQNGKFKFFDDKKDGIPIGSIRDIFADKSGHLWIASLSHGIFRSDNPTDEDPTFSNLSTAEGLSSNQTNCVTEDNFGQIYIGTGHGVDRLNPANNSIKLYTQADGLPGSVISLCLRDPAGVLWFVSRNSLVKFVPQAENVLHAPTVYIDGISVNGTAQKISELGVENVKKMDLTAGSKQIKIDFFALGFGAGDRLHYQYKLGNQEWSAPEEQKSVTFDLEFGDYQFAVRAVNADGIPSDKAASVSFSIAPPVYRRWWFLLCLALLTGGVILAIERYRSARLRELRKASEKLSASEQRFRRMIEQSSLGFVIFSPDGRLISVNRAYEKFWNITFEQIQDWKMLEDEQLIKSALSKNYAAFSPEKIFFFRRWHTIRKKTAQVCRSIFWTSLAGFNRLLIRSKVNPVNCWK